VNKTFYLAAVLAGASALSSGPAPAWAADKSDTASESKPKDHTRGRAGAKKQKASTAADNTAVNERDRSPAAPTADQQKNDKTDLELTAEIRRSVMDDKTLSMNAHNVKIIAQDGKVTLKGPVASAAEKKIVEDKADVVAGRGNVTSEIAIKR
jgi:hyperosmotically inducible protein